MYLLTTSGLVIAKQQQQQHISSITHLRVRGAQCHDPRAVHEQVAHHGALVAVPVPAPTPGPGRGVHVAEAVRALQGLGGYPLHDLEQRT
jgi:hypothetical protein